jgi:hypothetical protein
MSSWLFGRKIDPACPVELWLMEVMKLDKDFTTGNRTLVQQTNWSEVSRLKLSPPKGDFGIGNPIVICLMSSNKTRATVVSTKSEFEEKFGKITNRSLEARKQWLNSIGDFLSEEIKLFRELSDLMKK